MTEPCTFWLALRLWVIITVWHVYRTYVWEILLLYVRDLSTCLFNLTTAEELKNFIKEWFYLHDHGTRQADNEFIRLQRGNLHDYRWQVYFQSFSANTCNLVLEVWTNGHIFALNGGYFVYYPSNIFANHGKKSVQTVNRSLHGMFSFQCSLVRFYEHENMSPLF